MSLQKNIVGYTDRLSVQPGERQRFMISADPPGEYQASLVRLICGDDGTIGAGFQEEPVDWPGAGKYSGVRQSISPGSYGVVPEVPALRAGTVSLYFMPTLLRADQEQTLLDLGGLSISVTSGGVRLRKGPAALFGPLPVVERRWHWLSFLFDARAVELTLIRHPHNAGERLSTLSTSAQLDTVLSLHASALILGAQIVDSAPRHCFNGRMELPWLAGEPLPGDDALELSGMELPWLAGEPLPGDDALELSAAPGELSRDPRVVAAWDFSRNMNSSRFIDVSSNQLHGEFLNTPTRAVKGARWDGTQQDWKAAPAQYGAVHFHEDDLTDARWSASIECRVPEDLPSGLYAVKLERDGGEDYIPFFSRRSPRQAQAKVALLASTATYLAYANNRFSLYRALLDHGAPANANDAYLNDHPEVGLSLYERHADGSGAHYSSYLRPVLDLKPKGTMWSFNADTNLTAWLHRLGVRFDVVTDEDLHREQAQALAGYDAVITGTHPEYSSTRMMAGLEDYLAAGGRLMYMGGNGFYWRVAYHPDNAAIIELRRAEGRGLAWDSEPGEYYHAFSGEYGGLWRRLGRAPNQLVGVGFIALAGDGGTFYRRQPAAQNGRARFIFAGTREGETFGAYGSVCGGAVSQEIDRWNPLLGSPRHALVVASSEEHPPDFALVREEAHVIYPGVQGPKLRADMTFFETPAGGAVFSTGSIGYAGALAHNGYDNDACRIATNVLRRFTDPEPFGFPEVETEGQWRQRAER
jgi:N,N-dimethylformamidase